MPEDTAFPPPRGSAIGRFLVLGSLGAGGMGVVLSAYDPELDRKVALKLLHPGRGNLVAEAQAMARLRHPNVVAVHEIGPGFVVMEHVEGGTLRAWLEERQRTWREILEMYLGAGEGLAAAHREGIVHRDFKPDNVLVDADGRARVVDFGLVAAAPGAGTARYMAPELRAGEPGTPRSDQFAFCVSMHEALYGRLPAEPEMPSANRSVPRVLARTIARGLAPQPEDRWPSMDAFLDVAARPFWTHGRRRLAAALGAALVVAVAAVAFTAGQRVASGDPCGAAAAGVASLWDAAQRARVQAAFQATGRPYADEVFARVDASLRSRLATWERANRDACEDSVVRHVQSNELLDRRMECLGQARRELAALVSLLGTPDGTTVDRATLAAAGVGDVEACGDVAAMRERVPPPRDRARTAEVERLRDELARLEAFRRLGRMKDGLALADDLVPAARQLGYPPFIASALYLAAWFTDYAGDFDRALEDGYQAARAAGDGRDDRLAAQALSIVEYVLAFEKRRFEAADVAYRSALAAAARAGNPPAVLYLVCAHHAVALQISSRYAEELPLNLLCLALAALVDGPESGQFAQSLRGLADNIHNLGDPSGALALDRRALATAERTVGIQHPFTMSILNNTATTLIDLYDFAGAADILQRLLASEEGVFGPDNQRIVSTLHNLGGVRLEQRRLPEARALIERAIRVGSAKLGPMHAQLATSYQDLGLVARAEGHAAEAQADFEKALAIHQASGNRSSPGLVEAYRDLTDLQVALGRTADARATLAKARETEASTLGSNHPSRAETLRIAGDLERTQHQPGAAIRAYRQATAIVEKDLGHDHEALLDPLFGLSAALVDSGDAAAALATAERALAIAESHPVTAEREGIARFRLAQARFALGQDRAGALELARAARARLAELSYPAEILPEIDRWLARARRP